MFRSMPDWLYGFDLFNNRTGRYHPIGAGHTSCASSGLPDVNPATGLPLIDGIGSVDVGGNPWGTDLHDRHHDISCRGAGGLDDW